MSSHRFPQTYDRQISRASPPRCALGLRERDVDDTEPSKEEITNSVVLPSNGFQRNRVTWLPMMRPVEAVIGPGNFIEEVKDENEGNPCVARALIMGTYEERREAGPGDGGLEDPKTRKLCRSETLQAVECGGSFSALGSDDCAAGIKKYKGSPRGNTVTNLAQSRPILEGNREWMFQERARLLVFERNLEHPSNLLDIYRIDTSGVHIDNNARRIRNSGLWQRRELIAQATPTKNRCQRH
ncbi:hypothetical protein IQ07DRAFT_598276 [Pyrenochaeta sp. DS3sAY3a]|nr:hypothetical protein IQ07DRAFT_598276 [Pyrenochaeta sp. DS3sAY3a]